MLFMKFLSCHKEIGTLIYRKFTPEEIKYIEVVEANVNYQRFVAGRLITNSGVTVEAFLFYLARYKGRVFYASPADLGTKRLKADLKNPLLATSSPVLALARALHDDRDHGKTFLVRPDLERNSFRVLNKGTALTHQEKGYIYVLDRASVSPDPDFPGEFIIITKKSKSIVYRIEVTPDDFPYPITYNDPHDMH